MKKIVFLLFCTMTLNAFAQQIVLVKDSIMNTYMLSGFADKKFVPKGKYDKQKQRQGRWKDYSVVPDASFVFDNTPRMFFGDITKAASGIYLLYGEGEYKNDERIGHWKFWVIEDKTFKKYLHKEVDYTDGKLNGQYTYYYFTDGSVAQTGVYKENSREGAVTGYFPTGEIYCKANCSNDMVEGPVYNYYRNQKLCGQAVFEHDTLNGQSTHYYPDGTLQEKLTYVKGKENGLYQYYHPNGQLWIEREYRDGLSWNVTGNYDAAGKSRDKGTLLNGNGTIIFYDNDDKIYLVVTFENGKEIKEEKR